MKCKNCGKQVEMKKNVQTCQYCGNILTIEINEEYFLLKTCINESLNLIKANLIPNILTAYHLVNMFLEEFPNYKDNKDVISTINKINSKIKFLVISVNEQNKNEVFNKKILKKYEELKNKAKNQKKQYDLQTQQLVDKEIIHNNNLKKQETIKQFRYDTINKNPLFEYTTNTRSSNGNGMINIDELNKSLMNHSKEGWKLHSTIVNEVGKNTLNIEIGNIASGTNATVDITILIYERCIKT